MADEEILVNASQIMRLAGVITTNNMECIAEGYLGICHEQIKNTREGNKDKPEGFNRDILRIWCNKNPNGNQVKVSLSVFYLFCGCCTCLVVCASLQFGAHGDFIGDSKSYLSGLPRLCINV